MLFLNKSILVPFILSICVLYSGTIERHSYMKMNKSYNKNQVDKSQIFKIYKQIPFELNTLINAQTVYQSLEKIEGRALIYQKFLLSDNTQNKLDLLFLLKDLFKRDNLSNVYTEFLSDRLEEFEVSGIPENYLNIVVISCWIYWKTCGFDNSIMFDSLKNNLNLTRTL